MIERTLKERILFLSTKYPFVLITGPRQSGKSTLSKLAFPEYKYVSLEDPDNRAFATEDPRAFISTYPGRTIIDEVQRVPQLLSYLQTYADQSGKEGMYILTGSQNFQLLEAVSQSLAGRVGIVTLLPFSYEEMRNGGIDCGNADMQMFKGCYPRLFDKDIPSGTYYADYINTYVERDVRIVKNITNLATFTKFIKLCAGRIGQILNMASLATECGVSIPTINSWLSLLQTSYIVFLLQPDSRNFSKRLVKTPKLYFHDTGLACSLLEIRQPEQLSTHYLRGGIFENMVIVEMLKRRYNRGVKPSATFWRDSNGNEVDLLINDDEGTKAVEIKSGETYNADYFKGLRHWGGLSGEPVENMTVIYGGETPKTTSYGNLMPWRTL